MNELQLIATAPRDGSQILGYLWDTDGYEVCRWNSRKQYWDGFPIDNQPTHWTLLPKPPVAKTSDPTEETGMAPESPIPKLADPRFQVHMGHYYISAEIVSIAGDEVVVKAAFPEVVRSMFDLRAPYERPPNAEEIAKALKEGLTKREVFAAMTLQGLLSNETFEVSHADDVIVEKAVQYADKLLKELAK